jgi:hypothetical protein
VRVFTEEYQGRQGYTRRFLAATYSVSAHHTQQHFCCFLDCSV